MNDEKKRYIRDLAASGRTPREIMAMAKCTREEFDEAQIPDGKPDIAGLKAKLKEEPEKKERGSMAGKHSRKRISDATIGSILRLHRLNTPAPDIAEKVGVSEQTVRRYIKGDGGTPINRRKPRLSKRKPGPEQAAPEAPQEAPPVSPPERESAQTGVDVHVPNESRLFVIRPGRQAATLEFLLEAGTTLRLG